MIKEHDAFQMITEKGLSIVRAEGVWCVQRIGDFARPLSEWLAVNGWFLCRDGEGVVDGRRVRLEQPQCTMDGLVGFPGLYVKGDDGWDGELDVWLIAGHIKVGATPLYAARELTT